jgi:hypothetical protein
VCLPDVPLPWIKAKLDTGARTSSLHVFDRDVFLRDGAEWVRFDVHPWQGSRDDAATVELPVHDRRRVRSSSGHAEERIVVLMTIRILGRDLLAEVTLTNRDAMGFRMLVGRQALKQGFVVDSSRSYLGGKAPKPVRRANRGV